MSTSELDEERHERLLSVRREIPPLGLGTWQIPDGPECVNAVRWALELGYRHIDTAQVYGNETSVGRGLRESGVARDEVFVTTKFYPRSRDPVAQAEASLRRLGLDHVDLYMIHWPQRGATWAWPGMVSPRAWVRALDRRLELLIRPDGSAHRRGDRDTRGQPGAVRPV